MMMMMMMMMISKLFNFISFFIIFFFIFILGCVKGLIIGTITLGIIGVGNVALVVGLWPAHFIWTYFCVAKRLGWVLKNAVFVLLPLPLILWPIVAVLGSVLCGLGYGFFAPLAATFVPVGGEGFTHKFYHFFFDGSLSTVKGSLTVVLDFTDFCFYSYFSYMDELCEDAHPNEEPVDIELSKLPCCLLVSMLAILVDVPLITVVAIWKSPFLWYRGWKRLSEDLIGREGPFSETVCVPFAALTILLWPLAVVGFVIASFISSFFLAMYSGIVVYQEGSPLMGLAYILAAVSLFDEYTNDLLDMREGSCFIRPRYRRNNEEDGFGNNSIGQQSKSEEPQSSKMGSSRQSKEGVKKYTPMQVWDWLFKLCEVNGKTLLRDGVIDVKDIVDFIVKGKCNRLVMKLPAFVILECLLKSAKSNSDGIIMLDGVELTKINWPKNRIFEWFAGPLLIMKEQIKNLQMEDEEEVCLKKLIMCCQNDKPDEWDNIGFPSQDAMKRAQLQAIIRRLRGIVGSISHIPTFRRRFTTLVKQLYAEANQIGLSNTEGVPSSSHGNDASCSHINAEIV